MVGPSAKLGDFEVIGPQGVEPITHHSVGCRIPRRSDEVQDDRRRQEHPVQTSGDFLLLLREGTVLASSRLENRLLAGIPLSGDVKIQPAIAHFWTQHSGRAFMPSSTVVLGFSKEEQNFLGGWQAQASDRYARVPKLRVRNTQKAVVQTIQKNDRDDPLGEAETLTHLDEFMAQKAHPPEST